MVLPQVVYFFRQPAAPDLCTISPVSSSRQSYHCYYFLTSWLLWSLYKRGQLSKQQRDNRDCSFTFLLSEATKGWTWDGGEGGQTCADRNPAHQRWPILPGLLSACGLLTSLQTNTTSPAAALGSPCQKVELESSCSWRKPSWPCQMGTENEKPTYRCVLLPEEAALPAPKRTVAEAIRAAGQVGYNTYRGAMECVWTVKDCVVNLGHQVL